MGMFDYLYYEGQEYQSKDTPAQLCDKYKIENGKLYYEQYESEWVDDDTSIFGHRIKTWGHHWVFCEKFDGAIRFYRMGKDKNTWIEYHSLFMDGKLLKLVNLSDSLDKS